MNQITKSHILVVGPSLKMGGIERASSSLANSFAKSGVKTSFLAIFPQEKFFKLEENIHFYEPDFNRKSLGLLKTIRWIKKQARIIQPDRILVFNYFYGAIVKLSLINSKIPVFVSDRASPHYQWPKHVGLFNFLVYKFLPPAGIIAQTEIAAQKKRKFFGRKTKIKVIPNALREVELFPELKRENIVLAVGRLNDHLKGFDRLILAFALIKNKDWKLHFAGGDEEGEQLKSMAQKLGVFDRINFLGKVKDIVWVYARAGIFVIPSRSEGFPNALCEAMAAGLPCISFDFVAGPRAIINDGKDGLLVENGNIGALAAAIDHLIENPAEREGLGKNAMKIRERLKLEKIGKEYLNFILGSDNG